MQLCICNWKVIFNLANGRAVMNGTGSRIKVGFRIGNKDTDHGQTKVMNGQHV